MDRYARPASRSQNRISAKRLIALTLLCSQLFTACASVPTVLPPQVPEGDRPLKVGDILRIDVWRQPEYSGEFTIGGDGALVHPLYQEVPLAGLPVSAARDRIARFLAGYLQGARLVVEPLYSVSVAGEVRDPSVYHVARGTTIAEAIAAAGGPTSQAKLDRVLLVREGTQYPMTLGEGITSFGEIKLVSGDQVLVYRTSDFNVWRDVVAPVGTLASLVLAIVRINETTRK